MLKKCSDKNHKTKTILYKKVYPQFFKKIKLKKKKNRSKFISSNRTKCHTSIIIYLMFENTDFYCFGKLKYKI